MLSRKDRVFGKTRYVRIDEVQELLINGTDCTVDWPILSQVVE